MGRILETIKRWFGRQERKSMQLDRAHQEFDDMTDRVMEHKDHMIDRIENE